MKLSKTAKIRLMGLPIGILVGALVLLMQLSGLLERYELVSLDARYRFRGPRPISDDVLVVGVDDPSLNLLGWPLPRAAWAALIDTARAHGARAIGFDVLFLDPGRQGKQQDELFARVASKKKDVVFPSQMLFALDIGEDEKSMGERGSDQYLEPGAVAIKKGVDMPEASALHSPLALLAAASAGSAHIQLDNSPDGVFRGVPLFIKYHGVSVPALALRLALMYKGKSRIRLSVASDHLGIDGLGNIPLARKGLSTAYVHFKTVSDGIKFVSLKDVLEARAKQESSGMPSVDLDVLFRHKVVLVGQTAGNIGDHGPNPLSSDSPLVLVHANMLDNLVSGSFLHRPGWVINALVLIVLCLLVSISAVYLRMLPAVAASILILLVYSMMCQGLFSYSDIWLDMVPPIFAGILCLVAVSAYGHFVRDADERILRKAFDRYLAPGILERVLENPERLKLQGDSKRLTILFSDIKGYTCLSNRLEAQFVLDILRSYMAVMTGILFRHSATVDKIMGDGIMAFFGDPLPMDDHAAKAVRAAIQMQDALDGLQNDWKEKGIGGLRMRIGIATGEVYVGNIGSRYHVEYTALGRAVNLASRLETAAAPGTILISEETYNDVLDVFECEKVQGLALKGYDEAIAAHLVVREKQQADT